MPVEWSSSAPELLVTLDRTLPMPLRAQVEGQLRAAIQTGRLAAGERMPSSRALAVYLGLSRGVIQDCYAQLQAEGYLTSLGGSATRVAPLAARPRPALRRQPAPPAPAPAPPAPAPPPGPVMIADFQSGVPDLGRIPRDYWAWAVREACRTAPNSAFDYGDPRGHPALREVLAAYLRRVRAADAHPDQIVVCAGVQQGLAIVLRTLARHGLTRVACEDPGPIGTVTAAANAAGSEAIPVPVDEFGIDTVALAASGARVAVLTPAHQWPTGIVLTAERRHQLVAWARKHDAIIIEDDYDAEFRYDREPVGSLQGLAPDLVVTLGTVSKSLAPALRLGWAVVPGAIDSEIAAAKQVADRGTPGIDQLALAILIESGRYDRHLRRMRAEYSSRRTALVDALATHAPHVRVTGLTAGFHAVAHLPASSDEHHLVSQARALGVGLYGMSGYRSTHDTTPPQLVLGFGNTPIRAIQAGIHATAHLLRS